MSTGSTETAAFTVSVVYNQVITAQPFQGLPSTVTFSIPFTWSGLSAAGNPVATNCTLDSILDQYGNVLNFSGLPLNYNGNMTLSEPSNGTNTINVTLTPPNTLLNYPSGAAALVVTCGFMLSLNPTGLTPTGTLNVDYAAVIPNPTSNQTYPNMLVSALYSDTYTSSITWPTTPKLNQVYPASVPPPSVSITPPTSTEPVESGGVMKRDTTVTVPISVGTVSKPGGGGIYLGVAITVSIGFAVSTTLR